MDWMDLYDAAWRIESGRFHGQNKIFIESGHRGQERRERSLRRENPWHWKARDRAPALSKLYERDRRFWQSVLQPR